MVLGSPIGIVGLLLQIVGLQRPAAATLPTALSWYRELTPQGSVARMDVPMEPKPLKLSSLQLVSSRYYHSISCNRRNVHCYPVDNYSTPVVHYEAFCLGLYQLEES